MPYLQSTILGIIQGTTEFLPISSSAHLVLVPWIFGWNYMGLGFDTALHCGTAIAIVAYFWRDWLSIIAMAFRFRNTVVRNPLSEKTANPEGAPNDRGGKRTTDNNKFAYPANLLWQILIASIPAAIAGYFLSDYVEKYLHSPILLAINLAVFGIILWLVDLKASQNSKLKPQNYSLKTEKLKNSHPELVSGSIGGSPINPGMTHASDSSAKPQNDDSLNPAIQQFSNLAIKNIGFKQSLIVGLAQCLALIPGVSRSGITMTAGRSLGMNRQNSARFSFILSAPITVAAFLFEARKVDWTSTSLSFWLAIIVTIIVGLLTIKYLLKYLQKGSFLVFTVYRIALAILIVVLFLVR